MESIKNSQSSLSLLHSPIPLLSPLLLKNQSSRGSIHRTSNRKEGLGHAHHTEEGKSIFDWKCPTTRKRWPSTPPSRRPTPRRWPAPKNLCRFSFRAGFWFCTTLTWIYSRRPAKILSAAASRRCCVEKKRPQRVSLILVVGGGLALFCNVLLWEEPKTSQGVPFPRILPR